MTNDPGDVIVLMDQQGHRPRKDRKMNTTKAPQVGDKVEIYYKGKKVGVVIALHIKQHRKAQKLLRRLGVDAPDLEETEMIHVAIPGYGIVHTRRHSSYTTVLGKASDEEFRAGWQQEQGIRQSYQERRADGQEKAVEAGAYEYKPGDTVVVQYRGGVKCERTFIKITGSGQVKYRDHLGRERCTPAQFVTKAGS